MSRKDWTLDESALVGLEVPNDRQRTTLEEDRLLLDGLAMSPVHSVAELGCGSGQLICEAARRVRMAIAIDISKSQIEKASQRARDLKLGNMKFIQSSFLTWESPDAPFDLIMTKFAMHLLPDFWKAKALRRMFDNLKPGGRLMIRDVVFSCPPDEIATTIETWLNWMNDNTGFTRPEAAKLVREGHFTFGWIMEGLLASSGFRVIRSEYDAAGIYADYLAIKPKHNRASGFAEETELVN